MQFPPSSVNSFLLRPDPVGKIRLCEGSEHLKMLKALVLSLQTLDGLGESRGVQRTFVVMCPFLTAVRLYVPHSSFQVLYTNS
jgi:hypothetical protein